MGIVLAVCEDGIEFWLRSAEPILALPANTCGYLNSLGQLGVLKTQKGRNRQ
jgi:hypothetical protein